MEEISYQDIWLENLAITLRIGATKDAVVYISTNLSEEITKYFPKWPLKALTQPATKGVLAQASQQLQEYDAGVRQDFLFPYQLVGTDFQRLVWQELSLQPYGSSTTYGQVAIKIGRPKSVRAVANAVGRNPLMIVIPCHRVVGKNGKLTGFRGGLPLKRSLLIREGILDFE